MNDMNYNDHYVQWEEYSNRTIFKMTSQISHSKNTQKAVSLILHIYHSHDKQKIIFNQGLPDNCTLH